METSSQYAARFLRELSRLADHLAARDIVVGSLRAEYSAFGSWQLEAEKHHEAVRVTWDGRDGCLTIEGSPMRDNSAPNKWKQELEKNFGRASDVEPVPFVEEYLLKRFPV
jgi:hypothetical protein